MTYEINYTADESMQVYQSYVDEADLQAELELLEDDGCVVLSVIENAGNGPGYGQG